MTAQRFCSVWRMRKWRPDRYGDRCEVLVRGEGPGPMNELVEFEDGELVVGVRYSTRAFDPDGRDAQRGLGL